MKKFLSLIAVAAMAFAAQANELTVANGTDEAQFAPFYGFQMDTKGAISQVIYPADMLADMNAGTITGVKFYPTQAFGALGSGNLQISLKEVEQDRYTSTTLVTDATVVANAYPVQGDTEWTIVFDEPFEYHGGNLMIETNLTKEGSFKSTKFFGQSFSYAIGLAQYSYAWSSSYSYETENVLPKATFTYEAGETPQPTETCATPDVSYSETGNEQVTVTITNNEPGATVHYTVYNLDNNEVIAEGQFTEEVYYLVVEGEGTYTVECYASMPGMLDSYTSGVFFTIADNPQPTVERGDVNGVGGVDMDDLTALINYLLTEDESLINVDNAAACNNAEDTAVDMDDLTALINYLLNGSWAN